MEENEVKQIIAINNTMSSMMNDPQRKKDIQKKVDRKTAQDDIIHIANQQVYGIVDEDDGN